MRRVAYLCMRIREFSTYRVELLLWLISPVLQLVLLATLWRAVYNGRPAFEGISLSVMTTYVSVSALNSLVTRDDTDYWVERRVRTGLIATDLLRPLRLVEQVAWGSLAQALVKIPLVVLVIPVAVLMSGLTRPISPGIYVVSTVLGVLLNTCVMLLLASVSFWTLEISGINFMFYTVYGFANGTLIPLWFLPGSLVIVLKWLPFQAIVFTPVAIYVGHVRGVEAWSAVAVQVVWLVILTAAVMWVWRRAERRVELQGG